MRKNIGKTVQKINLFLTDDFKSLITLICNFKSIICVALYKEWHKA